MSRYPQVCEVRIYAGEVDIATVWPMGSRRVEAFLFGHR